MKYLTLIFAAMLVATTAWAQELTGELTQERPEEPVVVVDRSKIFTLTQHIRYNEGSVPWKNHGVLLTNFGSQELNPLGKEGKGYIVALDKKGVSVLIPADGTLDAPKGMAIVKDEYLFIADVGKVVVYHLKKLKDGECTPVIIPFPEEDAYVNDAVALGDLLLVSVTNTGNIYSIDVKDCEKLQEVKPRLAATIPGANGMAERDGSLYIASYNPNDRAGAENVIYMVDLMAPMANPVNILGARKGLYDGLAISEDGTKLYFTNWKGATGKPEVGYLDLRDGENYAVTLLDLGVELKGPADISIADGYLYIPDLPANVLYIVGL